MLVVVLVLAEPTPGFPGSYGGTPYPVSSGTYPISVVSGGATGPASGSSGSTSVFNGPGVNLEILISGSGGGGGAGDSSNTGGHVNGLNGGSGGGGRDNTSGSGTGAGGNTNPQTTGEIGNPGGDAISIWWCRRWWRWRSRW